MPVNAERLARLRGFGLTEYQARVYLALLDLGAATATQIPPHSGVPRTRIYSTMSQLHARGLVEILPESPVRYQPVPFPQFLKKVADEHRERARQLEEDLPSLAREFAIRAATEPEVRGRFEAIHGRRNARERLIKMYTAASKEVISIGTVHSPHRILQALVPYVLDKWRQGVQFRYAFPVDESNWKAVQRIAEYGEVRALDHQMPVYLHVVDGQEFMMSHPIPDDDSYYRGEDVSIWSDDAAISQAIRRMAENMWQAGRRPELPERAPRRLRKVD